MQTNTIDTLALFGHNFQSKVISALISDASFLSTSEEIIETGFFESEANRWVVRTIKEYFTEYSRAPTLDVFAVKVKEIESELLRQTIKTELKSAWASMEASDLDFVKDQFLEFCRNQKLKGAIISSVELLKLGKYDDIKTKIDEALNSGIRVDLGHDYIADFEERMNEIARDTVETPWEVINDVMDGGLGPGELGVIMAPSGAGKSWGLQALGMYAIQQGLTVAHYTLELAEKYTGKRYDSIVSGFDIQKLKTHKDELKHKVDNITGVLKIKYYPTKTASARTIFAHIEKMKAVGITPDLITIDYADLMKSVGTSDKRYEELGNLYEDLRGMSGEVGIPIWTATQANREAIEKEVIQADSVSDSYQKVMTADFVMSISRRAKDKVSGTARIHIVKNRFGPDGMTFPSKFDASIGKVEIFDPNSSGGILTQKVSAKGQEMEQQILTKKYNELMD